jgi:hypothetical protein
MADNLIEKLKKVVAKSKDNQEEKVEEVKEKKAPIKNMNNPNTAKSSNTKGFQEYSKKVLDSLNNNTHASIRNNVRKIIYEALLNKEELNCII